MSDKQLPQPAAYTPPASGASGSRSDGGSREYDANSPRNQLRLHTEAAAAMEAAAQNPARSILRLHDDELSCVLALLTLKDMAQLVRCNQRFNHVARKARSRGLHGKGDAAIAPMPSSALSHHATSFHLLHDSASDALLVRDVLRQLRGLPNLMALQITLFNDFAVGHFMQGLSRENTAAELRAALPTRLRSFSVTLGYWSQPLDEQTSALASSFWAALGDMTELTELRIEQHSERMHVRSELAGLAHLRKLTLGPAGQMGEYVAELKQLNQLRELTLHDRRAERIHLLCQPPHALPLESLTLPSMVVVEATMRSLLHLPTLTALDPLFIESTAWPLLPQLPHLCRLSLRPSTSLTPAKLSSLCAALSHCSVLEYLTLKHVHFEADDRTRLTTQQMRAAWAALMNSVPNLRSLGVDGNVTRLLPALPLHLSLWII
jgi:hypothetical protein